MIDARIVHALQDEWLPVQPIRVGQIPAGVGTPDLYVTVSDQGAPLVRIDVYQYRPDHSPFQAVVVWRANVVIGFGSHVHAVRLSDRTVLTLPLGAYFSDFYATTEYLLIASGERIFRMEPDRSVRWQSAVLGIDGVVVRTTGTEVIRGEGEWDPPGGWRAFALDAITGVAVKS